MPAPDSPVGDEELLLRRIPHFRPRGFIAVDDDTGEQRVSSGLYSIKNDEDGVSVSRRLILESRGLDITCMLDKPDNGLGQLTTNAARKTGLDVTPDPFPPYITDGHPRNAAHALIKGLNEMSKSERKRAQKALADATVIIKRPGDL